MISLGAARVAGASAAAVHTALCPSHFISVYAAAAAAAATRTSTAAASVVPPAAGALVCFGSRTGARQGSSRPFSSSHTSYDAAAAPAAPAATSSSPTSATSSSGGKSSLATSSTPPAGTNVRRASRQVLGIDLGTTHTCVSVMDGKQPIIIPDLEGLRTTPSVVAFTDTERILGYAAKRQAIVNPQSTVTAAKRLIGRKFDDPNVQLERKTASFHIVPAANGDAWIQVADKMYSPSQIGAYLLMKMKTIAESFLGETVLNAVITVPAYFNDAQRQATRDAGRIAGLSVLRVVNEPTAAALAYGLDKQEDQTIAVYDLGGGTFDVSILSLKQGVFEVMATNGDTYLGGEDFDNALITMVAEEFRQQHGVDVAVDPLVLQRLREACERAKIELDHQERTVIDLPFLAVSGGQENTLSPSSSASSSSTTSSITASTPTTLSSIGIESTPRQLGKAPVHLHLRRELTRAELEKVTAPLVDRTIAPSRQCMSDARVSTKDIGSVILVGGMTRMPRVREQATALFGREPSTGVDPIEAVAKGAAIQGGVLAGEVNEILLLDVAPLSLGIETLGGAFSKLIDRNTMLPCRKTEVFTTGVDHQTQVVLRVFQGERPLAADNQFLGEFTLVGLPNAGRGKAQIAVTFDIDANGFVSVSAVDKATGQAHSIAIEPCGGLSPAQIEWMVQEAERNAQTDVQRKRRMEVVAAVSLVAKDIGENIDSFASQLDAGSVQAVKQSLQRLLAASQDEQCSGDELRAMMEGVQKDAVALFVEASKQRTPGGV